MSYNLTDYRKGSQKDLCLYPVYRNPHPSLPYLRDCWHTAPFAWADCPRGWTSRCPWKGSGNVMRLSSFRPLSLRSNRRESLENRGALLVSDDRMVWFPRGTSIRRQLIHCGSESVKLFPELYWRRSNFDEQIHHAVSRTLRDRDFLCRPIFGMNIVSKLIISSPCLPYSDTKLYSVIYRPPTVLTRCRMPRMAILMIAKSDSQSILAFPATVLTCWCLGRPFLSRRNRVSPSPPPTSIAASSPRFAANKCIDYLYRDFDARNQESIGKFAKELSILLFH